jgi:aldehyde dehydrogenase (NAD+)
MPSHLKWGVPVAPTHRRSIGILHLNYWNAMMLLSQPFLLYLVLKGSTLNHPKRTWFEKLGEICIDAARNAVVVIKTMSTDQSISSLITFDCVCTLKVVMILALGLAKSESQDLRRDIEACVSMLENMEQVGFCRSVVQELPTRLAQLGFKSELNDTDVKVDFAQQATLSNLWPEFDP